MTVSLQKEGRGAKAFIWWVGEARVQIYLLKHDFILVLQPH